MESPAKAKTIGKYLGDGFDVVASVGHIRDLPKNNKKAIDVGAGFTPHYEVVKGKEAVVADIKRKASSADEVLLATDPDREGEAIAWHIAEAAKLDKPKRVVFHEITESAIREALKHPRTIDQNLRAAQEARRVLDRLVGYDLSGLIWKKVRYGLSAGRVQSPALRIIVEREREIRSFIPETYYELFADLSSGKHTVRFMCEKEIKDALEAEEIKRGAEHGSWSVTGVKETEVKRSPKPPFTTSTLQQAASSQLGYSPSRTMGIAQKLYESGYITYMRTDSVNLSTQAVSAIALAVTKEYGEKYVQVRKYATKSKNAQEAHEAIRPADASRRGCGHTDEQKKLYELIRTRTLASQMADAAMLRTKVTASAEGVEPTFAVNGSRVLFDGWLAADPHAASEDVILPPLKENDELTLTDFIIDRKETTPPGRYTEAGLVKELEKRGIGRPSTYASILKTLADRGYVLKEGRSLKPTDTGEVVSGFLEENFGTYVSDTFTAHMEDDLDLIAVGTKSYAGTLSDFYGPFTAEVAAKAATAKVTTLGQADPSLTCPTCASGMVVKLGRNGKFLSCDRFPECSGARTMEGVALEGPKDLGEPCPTCSKGTLQERDGRFGRFVACSRYPKCKFIKKSAEEEARGKTGVTCPECTTGEMVERRGRFGIFFSCSNYPTCKNAIKARPTGRLCDEARSWGVCGKLMMDGTKTIPERCSDKTCPNHNPHKKG